MPRTSNIASFILVLAFSAISVPTSGASDDPKRPLELADVVAWKDIRHPSVSNDGRWFAYQLAPDEGDAEVVIRHTSSEKELRFPIGEPPRPQRRGPDTAPSKEVVFSEDSRWLGFTVFSSAEEKKEEKDDRVTEGNKLGLIDLSTDEKVEFENVKDFAFSGELATWIALHKAPEKKVDNEDKKENEKDRPQGSDSTSSRAGNGSHHEPR